MDSSYESNCQLLGIADINDPDSINIYPKDFESKSDIIEYLDNYNKDKPKDEKVLYKDTSTPINKLSTSIMRAITIVLIVLEV